MADYHLMEASNILKRGTLINQVELKYAITTLIHLLKFRVEM